MSHHARAAYTLSRTLTLCPEALERRWLFSTYTVDDDLADKPNADFTSIQAAVTAAAPGDTIKVFPGTYKETVSITKDNLKVRAERRWDAVIVGPTTTPSQNSVVLINHTTGVEFRGFKIAPLIAGYDHDLLVQDSSAAQIRENWVTGTATTGADFGISVVNSTAEVRDNRVDNYDFVGIAVDALSPQTASAAISKNTVTGAGSTAPAPQFGIQVTGAAQADIRQNIVSMNVFSGGSAAGILLSGAGEGSSVSDNYVFQNDVDIAIDFTNRVTVEKNYVSDATYDGIELTASSNNFVRQNKSERNGNDGISLYDDLTTSAGSTNNTVEKNEANNNGADGIYVDPNSINNRITQNNFHDNARIDPASFDAEDQSHGTGTAGTGNFWDKNKCDTANPEGICDHPGKGNHGHGNGNGHGHGHHPNNHNPKHPKLGH